MPFSHVLWTGQKDCFNSLGQRVDCCELGQKSEYEIAFSWPDPRFELIDQNIIKDRATQLIWPRNASLTEYPMGWFEALQWINELNEQQLFGKKSWRLPNRRELRSLIDHSRSNPALPQDHLFHNVAIGWYWTSTTSAMNTNYAWYIHMEGGRMFYGNKNESYWLLPVCGTSNILPRTGQESCFDKNGQASLCNETGQDGFFRCGAEWPAPRFVIDAQGVLDQLTGLIWHPDGNLTDGPVSWEEALYAVKSYAAKTRQPFRLPTINEMESLVDASQHSPALPRRHFFDNPQEAYWTSTTSGFETDWSYVLYLHKGAVGVGYKRNKDFHVWPVMHHDQRVI
ncbi:DUF1566 domain-containing protein [Desulfogranum marinum]|uniref:Lcl C-terminal domain-containing protein n=1 Tax=Desulfogranum marinum TaxID=453220 RepID=UPI0029C94F18|nr:DUF1566 domain-containing protein [Desulfogranum marinum]